MIPVKCDSHPHYFPPVSILLIISAAGAFGCQLMAPGRLGAFVPLDFVHALLHPGRQTIEMFKLCFVSFFLHGNLFHLLSNMWYLWIFGNAVEYRMHSALFLVCYLIAGVVSMLVQALSNPLSNIPIVGASGAIAGIMGMHFVMLPFARIIVWLPPVFFLPVPAFIFLGLWFGMQYAGVGAQNGSHIAWWAHIGGFISGIIMAVWLKRKKMIS